MSDDAKSGIARRPLLAALMAALGIAAAGSAAYEAGLFGPSYRKTPYDDLLAKLPDRASAMTVGKTALAEDPAFDAATMAAMLRTRLADRPLSDVVVADIDEDRTGEVAGWVMPQSLIRLSALAAAP